MKLELNQRLETQLRQTLELVLSPKMLQTLKLLSLPYIELVDKLKQEAEENVMLEVERHDELFELIRYLNSDKKIRKDADFSEMPGIEEVRDKSMTLEEALLDQLELENLNEKDRKIAGVIIENIDDKGYISNYAEVREKIMKDLDVSRPTVDKVLKIVQGFEPDGVGARDLKECLLIQIGEYNFQNEELEDVLTKVVSKHLEDLGEKRYDKIAKSLGIPKEGVARIAEFIKENLNPYPGSCFAGTARHIIPSFAIEGSENGYKLVNLEKNYGPVLKINDRYLKMMNDPKIDAEALKFLKAKFASAKELMENIRKRYELSDRIMEKLKETQAEFLEQGKIFLKPFLQKELASDFDVHPSTISRAISEKYVQTPQGLLPIKFLFPRGHKGFTHAKLKSMIRSIVEGEDKAGPLSDEAIVKSLRSMGADVARRTVNAYRKELGISDSKDRSKKN
jgi:RNA polymerase sigma-54 factor